MCGLSAIRRGSDAISRSSMIACQKLAGMLTSPGRYTACLTMKVVLLRLRRLLHFSPRSYSPPRPRMPQTREAFPLSSHTRLYSLLKRPRLGRPCTARQHPCRRCVAAGTSSSQNHGRSSRTSGISTLLCLSSSPSTGTANTLASVTRTRRCLQRRSRITSDEPMATAEDLRVSLVLPESLGGGKVAARA